MIHGYKVIRNLFDAEFLDHYKLDDKAFLDELVLLSGDHNVFRTKDGDVKQIQNLQNHNAMFSLLYYKIASLLPFDSELMNIQYFIKHPNYKETAPHQDGAYFDNTDDDILTYWIPLQDVNIETSCMFYKKWSGERIILNHEDCGRNVRTRTGKTGKSQYLNEANRDEYEAVPLRYTEAVVHNQFCEHYSNVNSTDKPRVALTCIIKIKR